MRNDAPHPACGLAHLLPAALLAALLALPGCSAEIVEPTLPPSWPDSTANAPLTRADCIELAAASAPTAAAWSARRLAARAHLDQASLLPNPTLALDWEDFGLNDAASASKVQTTLSLAFALADVAARERREEAARWDLQAEEADLRAERARLAADVVHAYDELVVARTREKLQAELAEVARHQLHDVGRFVESGVSPRLDLERAEAETGTAQAELDAARAEARARELEFAFALGFEHPVALTLAEPVDDGADTPRAEDGVADQPVDGTPPLSDLLARAATQRPELAAAGARYAAERERLSLAAERLQFLPVVGAGPRTQGDELRGVAGISVELPLFDSGEAAEHGQQAALLAAAAALRRTAHDVTQQVYTALERAQAADAFLRDHARDLAARRRALRMHVEELFRSGESDYADLALARRDEVEARLALLQAESTAAAAHVDLDAAIGAFAPRD